MNRTLLNLTINLLAGACLLVMMATGYILRFPLPPTTNRTHKLWELSRHEWGTIHSWASLVLLLVVPGSAAKSRPVFPATLDARSLVGFDR